METPTVEELDAMVALSVRCKQCFAQPSQACVDFKNRPAGRIHAARLVTSGVKTYQRGLPMDLPEWATGWAADESQHCGQPAVTVECAYCRGSHVHTVCAVTGYDVPRCPGAAGS